MSSASAAFLRSTSAVTCGTFPFFYRYPWGSEAFEKARELNRPIFLSGDVGFTINPDPVTNFISSDS